MALKGRRQQPLPGLNDGDATNYMDQLAFKYMKMCKVESSTESESEISPRRPETTTTVKTFCETLPLTRKPAGGHTCYSLFLDPYDGSSEDSDAPFADAGVSNRRLRQQGRGGGGCRLSGRSRRFMLHNSASATPRDVVKNGMKAPIVEQQHFLDVQMKSGSDSELWICELDSVSSPRVRPGYRDLNIETMANIQSMDSELHCQLNDSGVHTSRSSASHSPELSTPVGGSSSQTLDSSSERSDRPGNLTSLHKRKLGLPGSEVAELGQRKRRCVVNMEEE